MYHKQSWQHTSSSCTLEHFTYFCGGIFPHHPFLLKSKVKFLWCLVTCFAIPHFVLDQALRNCWVWKKPLLPLHSHLGSRQLSLWPGGMLCGTGEARMINGSTVATSRGLSKHSQCLVLGVLSALILLASREIHFPQGALLSGCTPWEAELELRKQISSSPVLPALESCLPEFASKETLLWTEQICS